MHALTLLAGLTALAVHTHAAPTAASTEGFTVEQVKGKTFIKSGPLEMKKTYEKFRKTVPANVAAAAAAALQSGTVKATPADAYDSEYLCPVTVGSQTLNLDFDTGSSDLWVFSTLQPSSQQSGHTPVYNPATSGKKLSGETWSIEYGDGSSAEGVVYADKVVIGKVTATSQDVEAATSVSSEFVEDTNDGLVGLAFDNINTCSPNACPTFMNTVGSTLPSNLFTAYLKYHAAGSYDFGYINASKYTGSIAYTAVTTSDGFWEFTPTGYAVGSKAYTSPSLATTIADTGTTLIYVPTTAVKNYYAQVSGAQNSAAAGGWIFPCSSTLPTFSVTIGGASHTVPGKYMNYAPYSGSTCFGGIQDSTGIGFNILGDIFLKSQYVIFDVGNTRIGFATQTNLT